MINNIPYSNEDIDIDKTLERYIVATLGAIFIGILFIEYLFKGDEQYEISLDYKDINFNLSCKYSSNDFYDGFTNGIYYINHSSGNNEMEKYLIEFRKINDIYILKTKEFMCNKKKVRMQKQPKITHKPINIYFHKKMKFWETDYNSNNCSAKCNFVGDPKKADVLLSDYAILKRSNPGQSIGYIKMENIFRCFKSTNWFYNLLFFIYYAIGSTIHMEICCPTCFSNIDKRLDNINYLFHFDEFSEVLLYYNKMTEIETLNYTKLLKNIENKTGLAFTYISSCSNVMWDLAYYRTKYIDSMSNYVEIHSYGKCGRIKKKEPDTENMLKSKQVTGLDYKFFLVFENSIAYNYVSEKLWHGLMCTYTVPVYFGAPNVFDYFNVLDEYKLFIYANEYLNPRDLADYLIYLDQNNTAYLEYFKWKIDGVNILKNRKTMKDTFCRICEYIKK